MTATLSQVRRRAAVVWLFAATVAGCGDTTPTGPSYGIDDVRAAFTPEIAALLDENGELPLSQGDATGEPIITEARAKELALAYWRKWGPAKLEIGSFERTRPEGVSLDLVACGGRAYFTESAFMEPLDPAFNEYYRRKEGAAWIVRLCHGDQQHLAVPVPARVTYAQIGPDGLIIREEWNGVLVPVGVRDGHVLPVSPEQGAVAVARALGTRVRAVPVLRRRPGVADSEAAGSAWQFELETPTVVEGSDSGHRREVAVVWFGPPTSYVFGYTFVDLRDWMKTVVMDIHPWYMNTPRDVQWIAHEQRRADGSLATLIRRTDIAVHYERVRRVRD